MSPRHPLAPASARRLAALRIVLGLAAWIYAVARLPHFIGVQRFAPWQFRPVGLATPLSTPLPTAVVVVLAIAAVLAGAAFVLGWRWRISGPAFALLLLWNTSYRNSWGMVFHTENLMVLHIAVLAMSRAADTWSLDARGHGEPAPHTRYGAPIWLMGAVTVATYVLAGAAKLQHSGLAWVTSDILRNHVAFDNLRKAELGDAYAQLGVALVPQRSLFVALAGFALAMELLAPLALLQGRIARLWCVSAWAFHVGVFATMWIVFHYPMLGLAYASFVPLDGVLSRLAAQLPARAR